MKNYLKLSTICLTLSMLFAYLSNNTDKVFICILFLIPFVLLFLIGLYLLFGYMARNE